jgi:hypothetical protein
LGVIKNAVWNISPDYAGLPLEDDSEQEAQPRSVNVVSHTRAIKFERCRDRYPPMPIAEPAERHSDDYLR